jgi:general stress protein CsbA
MTLRYVCLLLITLLVSPSLQAQQNWIIAAQTESMTAGQAFNLDVIKPEHIQHWPEQLQLNLAAGG